MCPLVAHDLLPTQPCARSPPNRLPALQGDGRAKGHSHCTVRTRLLGLAGFRCVPARQPQGEDIVLLLGRAGSMVGCALCPRASGSLRASICCWAGRSGPCRFGAPIARLHTGMGSESTCITHPFPASPRLSAAGCASVAGEAGGELQAPAHAGVRGMRAVPSSPTGCQPSTRYVLLRFDACCCCV